MFCRESSWAATRPARPAPTIMTGLGGEGGEVFGGGVVMVDGLVDVDLGLLLLMLVDGGQVRGA